MYFRTLSAAALLAILLSSSGFAQGVRSDFPNYGLGSLPISATPGTQGGAAGAFWNPAGWSAMQAWEASFSWNDRDLVRHRMDDWGLFLGGQGLGFAMKRSTLIHDSTLDASFIEDYQLGLGGGKPEWYWGLAYGWSKGRSDWLGRDHYLSWGSIARPLRHLSVGAAAAYGLDEGDYRGIADLGVRPLGTHFVTAFADAAFGRRDNPTTMQWGAGLEVRPIDGLRAALKVSKPNAFDNDKIVSLSLGLAVDNIGFHVVPHLDQDNERVSTSYLLRLSDLEPDISTRHLFDKGEHVVAIPMKGVMTYQRARWFDQEKLTLYDLLTTIEKAKGDPAVGGIAFNLSGMVASRAMLWEVREKLADFQREGKKVYIYADNLSMSSYYFASVADYLWLDPQGTITTPGYVAGRTYMRGFLEKLGIGVEEWRFFTYKSAFESLARRDMSEPDKEQRHTLIHDFYDDWSRTIAAAREIPAERIRTAIDSVGIFSAEEALAYGLIDSIGTWDDTPEFVTEFVGDRPRLIGRRALEPFTHVDPTWGRPPEIAVVYAIGESSIDTGFKARQTSRILRRLGKDGNVKAVVLRADSPGGDALAADLIARQMKEIAEDKPMIVTQGDVAASGGYWISMYGDTIYASPYTVTGSIGVIGGWLWNQGFSDKTGFTADHVQVGEHADLGFGVTIPLIGAQVPDRNLNAEERARMEKLIRTMYANFTAKVAEGRDLGQAYVDSVGQGRVWSGTRAKELNLVDKIGGLDHALADARIRTGLEKRRHVKIAEYPRRGLFGLDELMAPMSPIAMLGRALGLGAKPEVTAAWKEEYEWKVIRSMAAQPGKPLLMLPPEDLPADN